MSGEAGQKQVPTIRKSRSSVNDVQGLNTFRASLDAEQERGAGVDGVRQSLMKLEKGGAGFDITDIAFTAKKANVLMQKSALAASTTLTERDTLRTVIEENQRRFMGCLMLPITILFFIFYAGAAVLHEDITYTHLIESPFRDAIVPGLDEEGGEEASVEAGGESNHLGGVQTIDQFWIFAKENIFDLFFTDVDANGNALPMKSYGRKFMYSQMIGAMVFETQRSISEPCDDELSEHMTCFPSDKLTNKPFGRTYAEMSSPTFNATYEYRVKKQAETNQPLIACDNEGFSVEGCSGGRRLEILRDELAIKMPKKGKKSDTYKFFFYQNHTKALNNARLDYLQNRNFFDYHTTQVLIKVLIINNELDIPRVDSIRMTFFLSRGGGIYTMLRMEAIFLESYSRGLSYVWDFLFLFLLICSTIFSSFEFVKSCIARQFRSYMGMVNMVVWLNIIVGWFNVLGFASFSSSRKDVKEKLTTVLQDNTESNSMTLMDAVDEFVTFAGWYRVFVADAHIIFMLRCFIALQWQPRLAVVTQTLKETTIDMFHFLLVFMPTFIAFAIAGNQMFGRRMQVFSTIEAAVAVCFKLAMESEFQWLEYSEEDFRTATIWVWLYILLVVLLMMNMVLAIMMDVYSMIRLQAGNSETIWANIIYLVRRAFLAKKWVKDAVLLERLEEMPRTISKAELKSHIPELTDYQLNRLMAGCITKAQAVMRMGVHESYTAQMTAAVKLGLDSIQTDIADLKRVGWMGRGVETGSLNNRMLAQDILQSAAIQTHWMNLMQTQLDNLRKKTHGLSEVANLLITIYKATGILAVNNTYATCKIIGGTEEQMIQTSAVHGKNWPARDDREWDEEYEITDYIVADMKGLEFCVFDSGEETPIMKVGLPAKQFYPNGWEGSLPFPGGEISVKVEIVNPLAETTV